MWDFCLEQCGFLCNSISRSQGETNALKSGESTEAFERR